MADFCKQCADELGLPNKDLVGCTTEKDMLDKKPQLVICEGCGYTQVDPEGVCLTNCLQGHGKFGGWN